MASLRLRIFTPCVLGALVACPQALAAPYLIYDGALGTRPSSQSWLTYLPPFGGGGTHTPTTQPPGFVTIDSAGASSNRGGYFSHYSLFSSIPPQPVNASWPTLLASSGYTIRFDMRLVSETHNTPHRAGTSLISIASTTVGIELGFWSDRIWVQNGGLSPVLFTQGEGHAFDTTAAFVRYELTLRGSAYTLYADGRRLLTGPLRSYTAFDASASGLPFNPYTTNNFFFIGDNTSSASGTVQLARIEILNTPVVYVPRCSPADIADGTGEPLSTVPIPAGFTPTFNPGVDEGDFNCFFNFYFLGPGQNAPADIADGQGEPLPPFNTQLNGFNPGVDEGDFNCFFNFYFATCL